MVIQFRQYEDNFIEGFLIPAIVLLSSNAVNLVWGDNIFVFDSYYIAGAGQVHLLILSSHISKYWEIILSQMYLWTLDHLTSAFL